MSVLVSSGANRYLRSMPGRPVVKALFVSAKNSPEVVLLPIHASHHAIALAAFATELEHAESLADTALFANGFALGRLFVTAAELLIETPSAAKASGGFWVLLVLRLSTEEAVSTVMFSALAAA